VEVAVEFKRGGKLRVGLHFFAGLSGGIREARVICGG